MHVTNSNIFLISAGSIVSPNHNSSSPHYGEQYYPKTASGKNTDNNWQLEAEVGCKIKLTFDQFDVEDDSTCRFDFVKISSGIVKDKFCGDSISPTTFISEDNTMNVLFSYDNYVSRPGFKATWESVSNTTKGNYICKSCRVCGASCRWT